MKLFSVKPLDVGFDLKKTGMSINFSKFDEDLDIKVILDDDSVLTGKKREVCVELSNLDYKIIYLITENGREMRLNKGKFSVQHKNDNYWIEGKDPEKLLEKAGFK